MAMNKHFYSVSDDKELKSFKESVTPGIKPSGRRPLRRIASRVSDIRPHSHRDGFKDNIGGRLEPARKSSSSNSLR